MPAEAEHPEIQWTRDKLFELAETLEAHSRRSFGDAALDETLRAASLALRFSAILSVQDECRKRAPYKPMYRIRDANGDIIWTCGHNPPHESQA
jgi:hypothetical protein